MRDLDIHSGAYVFYEDENRLYVGIVGPHSMRGIRERVREHRNGSPRNAPLASRMTIEGLGLDPNTTRALLAKQYMPDFVAFRELVKDMEVRAIGIQCCTLLAAFEIYAAVNLATPYNDFCTH